MLDRYLVGFDTRATGREERAHVVDEGLGDLGR
jgi:hypothetical protein